MENRKKYSLIFGAIVVMLVAIICIISKVSKIDLEEQAENNHLDNVLPNQEEANQVNQSNFQFVTYAQAANCNSFIKSITVNVGNDGKVKFVIGSMNSDFVVQVEKTFEIECQKGENQIDMSRKRYLIKEGQYLFMNRDKQNMMESQENSNTKSLIQITESEIPNEIKMMESTDVLPFKYSLEKAKEYNTLVIGNDITMHNGSTGLDATSEEKDYYALTKARLQNEFENVKMNRINAVDWEKNMTGTRKEWLTTNLPEKNMTNLDLVIFQLGDNYNENSNFETEATEMVNYIRKYSPNAEIIWIGLWDINEKILNNLPGMCERLKIQFINISDLLQPEYQSLVMQKNENTEDKETPKYYPNNEAMQMISNRIIEVLKFDF